MKKIVYYYRNSRFIKWIALTSIVFLLCTPPLSAQKFDLFSTISGSGEQMINVGKYIYISGTFHSSINFGTTTLTTPSSDVTNIYLAKYDTLGNFIWAQKGGNTTAIISATYLNSEDLPTDIAADKDGNIYLTGVFEGDSCHWGNLSLASRSTRPFAKPGFLVKINPAGKAIWLNELAAQDSLLYYAPQPINLDIGDKNLFISGRYRFPMVYSSSNTLITTPPGAVDDAGIWVAKLDTAGNMIQNRVVVTIDSTGGRNGDIINSEIVVSNDSTFFLSLIISLRNYQNSFSFGSTQSLTTQSLINSIRPFAIAKFSSFTNCDWIVYSTSRFNNNPYVKILDDKHGGLYFTGTYDTDSLVVQSIKLTEDSTYTGTRPPLFYGKINSTGVVQQLGSFENVRGYVDGISSNNKDEIILSGYFTDSIRVDGKALSNNGNYDMFVINTDSSFTPNWYQVGGSAWNDLIVSTSSDSTSSVFFFLRYYGLAQFGSRYIPGNSSNSTSIFGKLSECKTPPTQITFNGDTSLCLGDSVRLYTQAEPFSLIQWRKNNQDLFGESFRNLIVGDSGKYDVITNQSGCMDTSAAVSVEIEPFTPTSLSLRDTLCENEIIALNGGSPAGGVYFGNGVRDSIFDPSIGGAGITTVNYTYNNLGCSDTASQNVQIITAPQPAISGSRQVCAFDSSSTYAVPPNPGSNYSWSVSDGSIASGHGSNSIIVHWGGSGLGIVNLSEMNALGCDTTVSDTIDIVSPSISATILGTDSACANSIDYTYSVSTPSLFYNWSITGGVISSGIGSSSIQVKWNNVSRGYLSVQLFNSCGSNSTFYDTVAVFTKPSPSIIGDSSLCSNSTGISYTTTSTGMDYVWEVSSGGTITSGQNTNSILVNWGSLAGTESIKLIATNSNGCTDSIVKSITLLPSDSTLLSANICAGNSYSFGNRTLRTSGTYKDSLIAQNGCDSIITLNLNVQAPIIDSIKSIDDTLISMQSGATYQWLECDTINNTFTAVNGATNQFFIPSSLNFYALAISLNGCVDTTSCHQGSIAIGMDEKSIDKSDISIYPNPTNNFINLLGTISTTSALALEIRTLSGQLVFNTTLSPQGNQLNKKIDLSSYGKGVYFLRVVGLKKPFIKKVILQ